MDCRPDLFLETVAVDGTRITETFYFVDSEKGAERQTFCLIGTSKVPAATSHISFFDTLSRGKTDAVMITEDMKIKVFLNQFTLHQDKLSLCGRQKKKELAFEDFSSTANTKV